MTPQPRVAAMLVLVLCVGSCAAPQPEAAPPPAPTPLAAPAPAVAPAHAASAVVVQHFDNARARELSVVLSPDAGTDQIARIHQADQRARAALTALGLQGKAVTQPALAAARAAVRALEAELDQP